MSDRAIPIDGRSYQVDGRAVARRVIPDSEDLHAHYDATQLSLANNDSVGTFPDETGNGFDLTGGTSQPTYITDGINGNPTVSFDGDEDRMEVPFTTLSQPNHIFIVFELKSTAAMNVFDSEDTSQRQLFDTTADSEWEMFAGSALQSSNTTTKGVYAAELLFNTTNSLLNLNGAIEMSGGVGTDGLNGFSLQPNVSMEIGEILIYPQDKSNIRPDIESYLNNHWGITFA